MFQTCSSSGMVTQVSSALAIVRETPLCQLFFCVSFCNGKIFLVVLKDAIVKWWKTNKARERLVRWCESQLGWAGPETSEQGFQCHKQLILSFKK